MFSWGNPHGCHLILLYEYNVTFYMVPSICQEVSRQVCVCRIGSIRYACAGIRRGCGCRRPQQPFRGCNSVCTHGRPTDDPEKGVAGFLLPMGGHKGYGLALAVDILCGVLTGSGFLGGVKRDVPGASGLKRCGPFHDSHQLSWSYPCGRMSQAHDQLR